MPTHTFIKACQLPGASVSGSIAATGDAETNLQHTWASAPTNKEFDLILDESALQSLCLHSTVAATVKTNSSGAPQETFTLAANVPQIFETPALCQGALGGDVTKIFLTSAEAAGTLTIFSLADITP